MVDRKTGAGEKFADADLIGCPWRITVGRGAIDNEVEIRSRKASDPKDFELVHESQVVLRLKEKSQKGS